MISNRQTIVKQLSNQQKRNYFSCFTFGRTTKYPFSAAVETENLLFLSGQIGKDHIKGELVSGGIKAETKQVLENIKAVLEQHNSSLDRVVKCTVILADINDFQEFNSVYVQYFPNKPARTTFAAGGLAANAKIEIDVIASK